MQTFSKVLHCMDQTLGGCQEKRQRKQVCMPQQRLYSPSCHLISHQSVSKTQLSTTFGQACCCCFEWVPGSCQASLKAPSQDRNHPSPAEIRTGVSRCSCHSCQLLALNNLWYNIWLRKRHRCCYIAKIFDFHFGPRLLHHSHLWWSSAVGPTGFLCDGIHDTNGRFSAKNLTRMRMESIGYTKIGSSTHEWPCCSSAHDSRAPTCRIACHPITSGTTAQRRIWFAKWSFQHLSCCPSTETVDKPRPWLGDLRRFRLHIGLQLSDELQILPASSTCTAWTVRENFGLRVVTCTTNHPCPRRNQWIPLHFISIRTYFCPLHEMALNYTGSQASHQKESSACCCLWAKRESDLLYAMNP